MRKGIILEVCLESFDVDYNQTRSFVFNGDNKQVEINKNGNIIGRYFYDGEGKRVKKVTDSETTIFVYSSGKLVAEYSTKLADNPSTNYTTTDHLGSPRVITNELGQIKSRRDFLPFGEEIAAGIGGRMTTQGYAGNDGVRQQFTGYERDAESGLDYAQNRYFASKHGRFTSVDPLTASASIKNPQTFNRYSYVLNSPYKFTDPLGLSPCGVGTSQTGVGDVCNHGEDWDTSFGAETRRAEADYDQRLGNTNDASAANRAIKKGDQKAEAICAKNRSLSCERSTVSNTETAVDDNAPIATLNGLDIVDSNDPSTSEVEVLAKGDIGAMGGPTVDASEVKNRLTTGANVFLRARFIIVGGGDRGSFLTKEDTVGSSGFNVSSDSTSKWKTGKPTVSVLLNSATVYIPLTIRDGSTERISILAKVNWIDKVETGIPGSLRTGASKYKTYSFSPKVIFKFN